MSGDRLTEYHRKRDFAATPEPFGADGSEAADQPAFVVQIHDASTMHFDFRLEVDGVLKSWAVPKGPSDNPHDKRLAVPTTDHHGHEVAPADAIRKGHFSFRLNGSKLHGGYALTRIRRDSSDEAWLLVKEGDSRVTPHGTPDPRRARSARSGRTLKQTAASDEAKSGKR